MECYKCYRDRENEVKSRKSVDICCKCHLCVCYTLGRDNRCQELWR